ncbi:MAG: FHA domain-containing protein [Chloroflexi bacterium]|nr:MAG: FHA domain-containing protein [Chloroflexota bacterium]
MSDDEKAIRSPEEDKTSEIESKETGDHSVAFEKDDTLIKKPKTLPIMAEPKLTPAIRWGNVYLGQTAHLLLRLRTRPEPIKVEIQDGRFIIGRSQRHATDQPNLDLTKYGAYFHGVSRHHLAIVKDGNVLQIEDLKSTNGTYLNGRRLLPFQPRLLRDGDELCLGHLVVKVFFDNPDPSPLA